MLIQDFDVMLQEHIANESQSIIIKKLHVSVCYTDGKNLFRLKGSEQNSSLRVSVLKDRNLSHHCIPLSFLVALSFRDSVTSRNIANRPATNGSEEHGTLIMSLNCMNKQTSTKVGNKDKSYVMLVTTMEKICEGNGVVPISLSCGPDHSRLPQCIH